MIPPGPKKRVFSPRFKPKHRPTAFVKLKAMKCFPVMRERVLNGWSLTEVARLVQEDWKEYLDVTRDSLLNTLKYWRATIPPAEFISKKMLPSFDKAAEQVRSGLDELDELKKLYELQMDRIKIDAKTEKAINKLMPTMTQEIRAAREILSAYAELKMDLGLSKRQLGTMEIDNKIVADVTERYGSAAIAGVVSNAESRRKVLGVMERALQLVARKADDVMPDDPEQVIDMKPEPGGE